MGLGQSRETERSAIMLYGNVRFNVTQGHRCKDKDVVHDIESIKTLFFYHLLYRTLYKLRLKIILYERNFLITEGSAIV